MQIQNQNNVPNPADLSPRESAEKEMLLIDTKLRMAQFITSTEPRKGIQEHYADICLSKSVS